MEQRPILQVEDLISNFITFDGVDTRVVRAVDKVSFEVPHGDRVALIGESGCGKSTLAQSILRVLPPSGHVRGGRIWFEGEDLLAKTPKEMTSIRGREISMILQDPMMSLNPVFTIGNQIAEGIIRHLDLQDKELVERIEELLVAVNISQPKQRMKQYPHEMSGGMRQRVVGAIALSCNPKIIIADEATTNLDVTIQLQFLNLLKHIHDETGVTLMFITHDLGIVAEMCRRVLVMYAGKIVEEALVTEIFDNPAHPYAKGLLGAAFGLQDLSRRTPISGEPPDLANLPPGCSFYPRCPETMDICRGQEPPETILSGSRRVRCWLYAGNGERKDFRETGNA